MLKLNTRYENFFTILKRGLLFKESLEEDIDILFSLTINGIAYGVIRR
jgi:ATP-dependent helicase/DNAse subunit B